MRLDVHIERGWTAAITRSDAVIGVEAVEKPEMKAHKKTFGLRLLGGTAAATLAVGTMSLLISRPASATPQYAAQTGLPCGQCHQRPDAADGKLAPFGEKFKANGHQLPKEPPR